MVLDLRRQLAALTASDGSTPSPRGCTPRANKPDRKMKQFRPLIDESNAEEFDALCVIAGGKPDIIAGISACSFCEDDGEFLVSAVTEYTDIARHADTAALGVNTFIHRQHAGSVRGG
ncbi:hypothetical protein CYMTET_55300 [Cymbomonas tetramitiformis]|uniref:Uncharacterized protein n=1 Tax=Cymbomonas tetramitiformis TaxID=36881 RepID=A0AAE0BF01_9CHLO|nr:hypothetical protein CYMTET_55300 [Cymbomonas tetramitiformis]